MRSDEGAMASRHTGRGRRTEGKEDGDGGRKTEAEGKEAEGKEAESHITCTPRAGWQ